ncbi:hypothetical protein [Orenia marismortui]|uniref:Uncharacterized protein n=1 Tax=Orenia marismortui TaxID=46469 RepID=A0A4R8GFT6_9FIRM|nr:hypothetical protein [Orenia marismortui]TDX44476.1 hypothetical protein C7959_1544 [Orenia marismortui]
MNWSFLYLARLLGLEFPNVLRNILNKEECQQFFNYSKRLIEAIFPDGEKEDLSKEDELNIFLENSSEKEKKNRKQLQQLLDKMSKIDISKEKILFYFRIVEYPGLMTCKEFKEYFIKIDKNASFFNQLEFENQKEYIRKILNDKENKLSNKSNVVLDEEESKLNEEILKINKQMRKLLEIIEKNKLKNIFSPDVFKNILKHYGEHLENSEGFNLKIRDQEEKLLIEIVSKVTSGIELYLEVLKPWDNQYISNEYKKYLNKDYFLQLKKKLETNLEEKLSNKLLEDFKKRNGIKLDYNYNKDKAKKWLLLRKSLFNSKKNYTRIDNLIKKAETNKMIQENFYNYFTDLISLWDKPLFLKNSDSIKKLLKDKEFLNLIWSGVIVNQLSDAKFYDLKYYIEELEEKIYQDEFKNIINNPYPNWWSNSEEKIKDWGESEQ